MEIDEIKKELENRIRMHILDLIIKRFFDVILSIAFIVLLSPFMIIIAAAIKFDSRGRVIFTQKRVGRHSRIFTIYKFRTMVKDAEAKFKLDINAEDLGSLVFQDKNDSRITKVGHFLRKTSLDELPQLLNVLFGNMSLVGPRPEIPAVADYYDERQKLRLIVNPGITGLAQVSGRGEIELEKTIEHDLEYIRTFSILLDIKILLRTVSAVYKKEGAY